MAHKHVRTASPNQSIWLNLPEEKFRQHLIKLEERTNAVPMGPKIFATSEWLPARLPEPENSHTLPLDIEQQLADDFAFLAAVEEGAQSVAAICVEEQLWPPGLTLRFAALDTSLNDAVKTTLHDASGILSKAASDNRENATNTSAHVDLLFYRVIQLHFHRLLARLRSNKWKKPKYLSRSHKKPLWQDFSNLIHRTQFVYSRKDRESKQVVEKLLDKLASVFENFEAVPTGSDDEMPAMLQLVNASFLFCTTKEIRHYAQSLANGAGPNPTKQVTSAIKCLRQIEKIAGYRRLCLSMITTAKQYPKLFQNGLTMAYLTPYQSVPTSIGYEDWATTCHVHAEIQLVVYYDIMASLESTSTLIRQRFFHLPRAIGTSKWLCYLCCLFLQAHQRFFPSKTHGRLFDQWTIPDLAEFDEATSRRYRSVLNAIDIEIVRQTDNASKVPLRRVEPMTSRQDLLCIDHMS